MYKNKKYVNEQLHMNGKCVLILYRKEFALAITWAEAALTLETRGREVNNNNN